MAAFSFTKGPLVGVVVVYIRTRRRRYRVCGAVVCLSDRLSAANASFSVDFTDVCMCVRSSMVYAA